MTRRRTLKVRRIFTILASSLSLLAIIGWLRSSPGPPTALLVSTPWNATFPFHLVDTITLSSSALRLHWPDRRDFFPTHVIAHPLDRNVFLATNEVQSGSVIALRLVRDSRDPYLVVLGTSDSGGRAPAHCIAHRQSAYCINVSRVSALNPTIGLTLSSTTRQRSQAMTYTKVTRSLRIAKRST